MEKSQIEESRLAFQRTLIGLGIEHSMSVVDEWRIVLRERGKCSSMQGAIDLLREIIHMADEEGEPVERPNQAGKWIGKILKQQREHEEDAKPKPTTSKNLTEIANKAQEEDMRDPERIKKLSERFDVLVSLEKENGTFDDGSVESVFHANRRKFAGQDLIDKRVRDCSERYVDTRIDILKKTIEAKNREHRLDRKPSPDAFAQG